MLTAQQLSTLKAAILADPVLGPMWTATDDHVAVANAFNLLAVPDFTVWKTLATVTQVGDNIVADDLAGLSSLNSTRLQTLVDLSADGINPSLADRRQFFADVFSGAGGAATRVKLDALWRRLATRTEQLFATGTGSNAAPATMTVEGELLPFDVQQAKGAA